MIRVCIVAPKYMTGGQAISARSIVSGFANDPEIRVELQPIDPKLPGWLAGIRGIRTLARIPLYLGGLFVRMRRADVIHVLTAAYWPFLLTTTPALVVGRLLGKPIVLNYHDGRAPDHLRSRWVRRVIGLTTHLAFPSDFLREVFRRFGFDGSVIHNVVDTERFRFRPRDPIRPVLISCRLLEELYAVENTLYAFERVRQVHPAARLLIVGGGDQEQFLKGIVRDRGITGVYFVGMVPHQEIGDWFDKADVFVNSSREDNMPVSIIEAFSSGLPVVTTGSGGIPFIVEHERNGLLVEIDNPEGLAAAILRVLEDRDLTSKLVTSGRRDCEEQYSWNAVKQKWVEVYRRLGHPAGLERELDQPEPRPEAFATTDELSA